MRLYEFFLVEYKTDITQQKYDAVLKQISPDETILQKIEQADPTKNKQYVLWIIEQLQSKLIRIEDLNRVLQALTNFDQLKPRLPAEQRDIGRMTIHQLEAVVDAAMGTETTDEFKLEIPGAEVLYNGPLGTLVSPTTEEAACELGKGTKWCTSADTNNYFNYYNKQGPMYIWKDKTGKYQFHFDSIQLKNSADRDLEQDKIDEFRRHPVLKKLFDENYDQDLWEVAEMGGNSAENAEMTIEYILDIGMPLSPKDITNLRRLSNHLIEYFPRWIETALYDGELDDWDLGGEEYSSIDNYMGDYPPCWQVLDTILYAGIFPKTLINITAEHVRTLKLSDNLQAGMAFWFQSFKPTHLA